MKLFTQDREGLNNVWVGSVAQRVLAHEIFNKNLKSQDYIKILEL